jgi:hypothetical protein
MFLHNMFAGDSAPGFAPPTPPPAPFRTAVSDAKLAMLDAQGFHSIAQRFMRRSEAALRIVQYANQRPGIKGAKNSFEPKR